MDFSMDFGLVATAVAMGLTLGLIYYHMKVYSYWSSRGIKGPLPLPLLGTNWYYLFKHRIELESEWTKEYGTIFGTYQGYVPHLIVTDNEVIKHFFIKDFHNFTDRNINQIHGVMKDWFFFSEGKKWANQRALITPMFTSSKMKGMFETMSSCVKRLMEELDSRIKAAAASEFGSPSEVDEIAKAKALAKAQEKPVLTKDEMMALTLDVIGQTFFSLKLDTYRNKAGEFYRKAFDFAKFDVGHFIGWLFLPDFLAKRLKIDIVPASKFDFLNKIGENTIKERRKPGAKRGNDFVQALLEAKLADVHEDVHDEEDDREAHYNDNMGHQELDAIHKDQTAVAKFKKFTDDEIRGHMTFFYIAGFDTTASSLSFCIYELAHQQDAQQELYQELLDHPKLLDEVDYTTLLNLKKMDAFISEALRLYAPVVSHLRQVTAEAGVTLPTNPPIKLDKGVVLEASAFVMHRLPQYWPEPLKFDMTRFYPENRSKIQSCTYAPFGLGPRNCAGMRFALLEIKLTLARLLLKYRVAPAPSTQQYPPKFTRHAFFLQLAKSDFKLEDRALTIE